MKDQRSYVAKSTVEVKEQMKQEEKKKLEENRAVPVRPLRARASAARSGDDSGDGGER
jgi:hypothetical protein